MLHLPKVHVVLKVSTKNKVNYFLKRALPVGTVRNNWLNQALDCELIFNLKRYISYI